MARKRNGTGAADLAAMDAQLGKERRTILDRNGGPPIQRGELVRVSGIGAGRRMRFRDFVIPAKGEPYVSLLDTVEGPKTGGWIAVRPSQVRRCRKQEL